MENTTPIGLNRTGVQMSPLSKDDMVEFALSKAGLAPPDEGEMEILHLSYIAETGGLGSVPLPGTIKGAVSVGKDKLLGNKPEVLIDKLGERLAFERTGTRLYDALILKCNAADSRDDLTDEAGVDIATLMRIRRGEENHFQLVRHAMTELGADPTAMTPCADSAGVSAIGLLQTISDPATTVAQSLNAILIAELADNAGWELLIELASATGHEELAEQFAGALEEEREHLQTIKQWLRGCVLAEGS